MKLALTGAVVRRLAGRIILLLLALVFALALAEVSLRILKPELQLVASSALIENSYRIHTNPRNLMDVAQQPGVTNKHLMIFNALGLRQHRDFAVKKPAGTYRIGFFGDSFAANLRLPAQYSFSDPLDYLLNRAGKKVEVLNFGTDGYGTDQCYLQYLDESPDLGLDMVVYLLCENDLRDNVADHLFEIDAAGQLAYIPRKETSMGVRMARRLYLTYFMMMVSRDQGGRMAALLDDSYDPSTLTTQPEEDRRQRALRRAPFLQDDDLGRATVRLFLSLLRSWKAAVEQNGQTFHVALVPMDEGHNAKLMGILQQNGFDAVDLFPTFKAGPGEMSTLFFTQDIHWNAAGNTVATVALYRYLAPHLSLDDRSDEFIRRGLSKYYSAFEPADFVSPWHKPVDLPTTEREEIKSKYTNLETTLTERKSLRKYSRSGGHL